MSAQPLKRLLSEISKELDGTKGRFVLVHEGHEAELTFTVLSPQTVIADHTGVPDALRGIGVGRELVAALVEDSRKEGYKIVPLCPFVNKERGAHPEWADAFQV